MKSRFLKIMLLLVLLIIYLFISIKSYANSVFYDLSSNIFRLHIIANSDSECDQALKLKVRDKVIQYIQKITSNCNTKEEVIQEVSSHLDEIHEIAKDVINDNKYNYPVTIEIGNFNFPTKYYGNVSMPAGNYDALRINIGEGKR